MKNRAKVYLLLILVLISFSPRDLRAQEGDLSITVQEDGDVYIHHAEMLPFGYGFNIYRKDPGGEFVQLNEAPVTTVSSGPQLVDRLGTELYNQLEEDLETEGPTETLLRLKNDEMLTLISVFVNPQIARALGFLYVDENAPLNEEVEYRVEIVDTGGGETGQTLTASAELTPFTFEAPSNLTMDYDGNLIVASWEYPNPDSPEKIAGFNVYRESPGQDITQKVNDRLILYTNNTEFRHTAELTLDGSTWDFYVKTVDITGQESGESNRFTFRLVDVIPPSPVKNVNASVFPSGLVEITWSTSVEPDAVGYYVYRAPRSVDPYKGLHEDPIALLNTMFVDSTAQPGNRYVYTVTAIDSSGNESKKSRPAPALLEDHEPPTGVESLTVEYMEDTGTVQLFWEHADPPSDFRTYMILRRAKERNGFGPFSQVNDSTVRARTFNDTGLAKEGFPPGAFFQYGVVAIDSATNFSDTALVIFQIPDLEPPEAPASFNALNNDGYRISLTWNASASNDVVNYNLYKNDSLLARQAYDQRHYRDEEVTVGEEYIYEVSAVDSLDNESPRVSDTILMRDFSPPAQVRNLQAVNTDEGIRLQWEQVPNDDLEGYRIYQCDIPTGVYEMASEELVEENSWVDPDGETGTWYRVIAIDTSGNESNRSKPAQAENYQ